MPCHAHSFAYGPPAPWKKRLNVLALFTALTVCDARADSVIWIGRPNVHDYIAYSLQEGVEQFLKMQQSAAIFNAQIAEARQAYFAASPANRAAAGDRFGKLLFQKDLMIAAPRVMSGNEDSAKGFTALMMLANDGKMPDGGIPPSARAAYGNWVNAMKMQSGSSFGNNPDPIKAAQALKDGASLGAYEPYRRLRDQAEFDEYEALRNGGARRLMDHGKIPARMFIGTTDASGLDARIKTLDDKVLRCTYAGMGTNFYFWSGQPPQDISSLLAMNYSVHNDPLNYLKDHAADECPADSKQAAALAALPMKEPLTPQMLKDGRAQAHTVPRSPEEQARVAQAREQAQSRQAKTAERGAAFQVCNNELKAATQAASLARDRIATQEAHQRYLQCMSEARSNAAQ